MALDLPAWYEGGFEDVEELICDFLTFLLKDADPEIPVVTWLVDDYYKDPRPMLRVHRASGKAVESLPFDHAVVQIAALSRSRAESWELMGFVRQVMAAASGGFKVPRSFFKENGERVRTQINSVDEWVGPIQAPDEFIDDRLVTCSYRVLVRESRFRSPDYYRQIMNTLPY